MNHLIETAEPSCFQHLCSLLTFFTPKAKPSTDALSDCTDTNESLTAHLITSDTSGLRNRKKMPEQDYKKRKTQADNTFFTPQQLKADKEAAAREACRILFAAQIAHRSFPSHEAALIGLSKIIKKLGAKAINIGIIRYCPFSKYHLAFTYIDNRRKILSVDLTAMLEACHMDIRAFENTGEQLRSWISQYFNHHLGTQKIIFNEPTPQPSPHALNL